LNGNGNSVISVRGLRKSYGAFEAVRGISFEVHAGEVFGLLGPNGAGKTTTVEILEGLRPRSGGETLVLGFDPAQETRRIKDRIGVCLQATNLPDKIKVHEAISLFAAFYSRNIDTHKLLERLQLAEKRDEFYSKLSGGQKQRVALALALVNDPQLLFLDEPTTGLDPQVRLEIHNLIQELRGAKRSILLTTHYIEEAERLCDRVAIIDHGRLLALDTPKSLKARAPGGTLIELTVDGEAADLVEAARRLPGVLKVESARDVLRVYAERHGEVIAGLVRAAEGSGRAVRDIHLIPPSLETLFVALTGRKLD
jgi:ABC-2 type transport system ATP-binding protein